MKQLKKKHGQSVVEFTLVFPVFLLFILGLIQLSIIFLNYMMAKYSAYALLRVYISYTDKDIANKQTQKAYYILTNMINVTNSAHDTKNFFKDLILLNFLNKTNEKKVFIRNINFNSSKGKYVKLTINYDMPLKVPVVNKIFGLFSKNKKNYIATKMNYPVYTIKASAIMRN